MPFSKAATSDVNVEMPSLVFSIAVSRSRSERSKAFRLSSASSNCLLQYSRLLSSSTCSFFNSAIMLSTILMTLSKLPLLRCPSSESIKRSRPGRPWAAALACAARRIAAAFAILAAELTRNCTKLALALAKVCLNKSRASSSLSALIVSERATSSSDRILLRSSHSAVFVAQFFSSWARNFSSAAREFWVSSRSSFICTISTPSSPMDFECASMAWVSASTSLFLAAMSS
mmetsp:Transcript_103010/g.296654  ORF Transcript_103010/g.296654 Transcript_103010/m.296654 type:complete len:231 (-) Transcript_103010:293-985(-)